MKSLISYTSTPYYFPFFIVIHYHNGKAMYMYISPSTIYCACEHAYERKINNIKFYAL